MYTLLSIFFFAIEYGLLFQVTLFRRDSRRKAGELSIFTPHAGRSTDENWSGWSLDNK